MVEAVERAMFPLETAMLPNQDLPLRVFEPRYGALVTHCTHTGEPFGVVMIARGREVGGDDVRCDVGVLAHIIDLAEHGEGRYSLNCRTGERIRVHGWLFDQPYPRATVELWPDEPGEPVIEAQLQNLEDRVMALFERIADAREMRLPRREVMLDYGDVDRENMGERLFALAARIPLGAADRYAALSAPSAADRLVVLTDAVESVAAAVEFRLSE